jgi:hypothetical protein
MSTLNRLLILLLCFSCSGNSEIKYNRSTIHKDESKLVLTASLKASYSNYSNPNDRYYYYLVDLKLINNTDKEYDFYTLSCSSLINIITDSKELNFLYHICSTDHGVLVKLNPAQEYCIPVILLSNKYVKGFGFSYNTRFGFIISKPKSGLLKKYIPMTNQEIKTDLKLMREKQENVIWSDPVILSTSNFKPYELINIINDSTYSMSERK